MTPNPTAQPRTRNAAWAAGLFAALFAAAIHGTPALAAEIRPGAETAALVRRLNAAERRIRELEAARRPARPHSRIQPIAFFADNDVVDATDGEFERESDGSEPFSLMPPDDPIDSDSVEKEREFGSSIMRSSMTGLGAGDSVAGAADAGDQSVDEYPLPLLEDEFDSFRFIADEPAVGAAGKKKDESALEKRLAKLEEQFKKQSDAEKKKKEADSQKPTIKFTGQVQTDYVWFNQSEANRQTIGDAQDGAYFRRARIGATGDIWETVEYRIEWDFALRGRPTFLDNWILFKQVPYAKNIKVGRFFEPWSLERFTANRFMTFNERSLLDTFAPARTNGIMAYDAPFEERMTWAAGLFRSTSDQFGGNVGSYSGWAGTARVTGLPYVDETCGPMHTFLHLGAAYSLRFNGNRTVVFATTPEVRTQIDVGPANPIFVNTLPINSRYYQLIGSEAAWVSGPLSIQGEYAYVPVQQIDGPNLGFQSAYGYVSYFLTGESRPYRKNNGTFDRLIPNTNALKPTTATGKPSGIGAWELAARYSFIDTNNHNVNGGELQNVTLGINWYLNPYTRIGLNYVKPMLTRAPVGYSQADAVDLRFGFEF